MAAVSVTLAGVTLSGAQQPLPIPVPLGEGPPDQEFITRESASEGPRRVATPIRYHVSWDDIDINCTVTNDTDLATLETSYRNRHSTLAYVYNGTTWTCRWPQGGLQVVRFNISLHHYTLRIKLKVLSRT